MCQRRRRALVASRRYSRAAAQRPRGALCSACAARRADAVTERRRTVAAERSSRISAQARDMRLLVPEADMKLYYSPGACSLSPHIVLREAERRFDLERVDLKAHRTASGADYLTINRKGSVPALQLDGPGGPILTEVPAILQYIGDLVPDKRLVPPNGTFLRYHLQEWLNFISTEIHKQFSALLDPKTRASHAEQLRGKLSARFLYLQDVLDDRAYLMGETFTVADAYLFVMLQWCGRHGIDIELYPNLDDYEHRIAERHAVQAALAAEGLLVRHAYRRSA
jgi:glutathione S-transferase